MKIQPYFDEEQLEHIPKPRINKCVQITCYKTKNKKPKPNKTNIEIKQKPKAINLCLNATLSPQCGNNKKKNQTKNNTKIITSNNNS